MLKNADIFKEDKKIVRIIISLKYLKIHQSKINLKKRKKKPQ